MSGVQDSIAVVVPTYWTRAGGQPQPGDAVYDHPTPLDTEGTLGRLLSSLEQLDASRFYVVLIVAVTSPDVAAAAGVKVREIAAEHSSFRILVLDAELLKATEAHLPNDTARLLGLEDYSRVRNLQLLAPLALGCTAIVAVDDDEVVRDQQFLDRAVDSLGRETDGHRVDGLGGYYDDSSGSTLLQVPAEMPAATNIFDRKAIIMNAGTEMLERIPGEIVPTPFCFGGNMIFSIGLAASVCFDPAITRGEDIDYLINARLAGRWFFMNKALRILHLPPTGGSYRDVAYHKVVQDVLRFIYEREKLRSWRDIGASEQVTAHDLDPYPGKFLGNDLDQTCSEVVARIWDATTTEQHETLGLLDSPEAFLHMARELADRGVAEYRGHQDAWSKLTSGLATNTSLRAMLENQIMNRTHETMA